MVCGTARGRSRNNSKDITTAGVQGQDDGVNHGDGLGNGKNGRTFATPNNEHSK